MPVAQAGLGRTATDSETDRVMVSDNPVNPVGRQARDSPDSLRVRVDDMIIPPGSDSDSDGAKQWLGGKQHLGPLLHQSSPHGPMTMTRHRRVTKARDS